MVDFGSPAGDRYVAGVARKAKGINESIGTYV
jgi:hypothetical protein